MGWGQSFGKAGERRFKMETAEEGASDQGELDRFLSCLSGWFISLLIGSEFIIWMYCGLRI